MLELFKKHNRIWAILFSLIGITLVFIGGMFSSNTKFEKTAEYVTDVVLNQTSDKPLCALTVGKIEDGDPLLDADSEFHNTYGTFMQQRIAFASAVNPDKELAIKFSNIETSTLSLLYGGAVGTVSYDGHFKHNTLPIELMFSDERMYDISNYVIYISQSHADSILDSYNLPRQKDGFHTNSEYESLLKQLVPISINGVVSDFVIQNIYFEFNYYYEGLFEVMGDFAIFSYYLPDNLRSEQRNIYFMDEYVYHNKYFMNYIVNAYPSRNFSLKINHYNIVGEIDEDFFLSFYYSNNIKTLDWMNVISVTMATLLLCLSLFFVFFFDSKNRTTILYSILHLGVLFVPYLLFSLLYAFTKNIYFLSETASKTNMFIILIYSFVYIVLMLFRKRFSKTNETRKEDYHEISI